LEPELPAIADAILRAIGEEVPDYARPLEGTFGRSVRNGVTLALTRFLALVRDPDGADPLSRVYITIGREELGAGRTLDALQAAYRVGARVSRLAEAIFAYIDELSAESVEGYAQAHSELAGERERMRSQVIHALLRGAALSEVSALADGLGWTVPRAAAVVACPAADVLTLAGRLGPDVAGTVAWSCRTPRVPVAAQCCARRWVTGGRRSGLSCRWDGSPTRGGSRPRRSRCAPMRGDSSSPRSTSPSCCSSRAQPWSSGWRCGASRLWRS
jgi:hypothetical protein